MNSLRRIFLKASALGLILSTPLRCLAQWNTAAFAAVEYKGALQELYDDTAIEDSDRVKIAIHSSVENGSVVPIKVETDLPAVKSIDIFIEQNPNPLIARFELNPRCEAFISARLKFNASSNVIVVINANGRLYKQQTFVEVMEGGCG